MVFSRLRELLSGRTSSGTTRTAFQHEVLGRVVFNEDTALWEALVHVGEDVVSLAVGGKSTPSIALMEEAVRILHDFSTLKGNVRLFLEVEALRLSEYTDEIGELAIEQIVLSVPEQPGKGMLYFMGRDDARVWRCDLLHGQPKPGSLGFDD